MTPSQRLRLIALLLVLSALYAVVVAQDPEVASAISSGYVAIVATIFLLNHFWKRPQ